MALRSKQCGRLADNVCAAVCRMISAQQDRVPLQQVNIARGRDSVCSCRVKSREGENQRCEMIVLSQVIPVLMQNIPLKEDMEETVTVYGCIIALLAAGNPVVSIIKLLLSLSSVM